MGNCTQADTTLSSLPPPPPHFFDNYTYLWWENIRYKLLDETSLRDGGIKASNRHDQAVLRIFAFAIMHARRYDLSRVRYPLTESEVRKHCELS